MANSVDSTAATAGTRRGGGRFRRRGRLETNATDNHRAAESGETPRNTNSTSNAIGPPQDVGSGHREQSQYRGHRRGGNARGHRSASRGVVTTQGRMFGGHLTTQAENANSLQPDAPEFVPGATTLSQTREPRSKQAPARKRRLSKSTAPDLSSRIHEDIDNGQYECMVCTNEVFRNSKVWSCSDCFAVFHVSCIRKWASAASSRAAPSQPAEDGSLPPPRQWRCPGCNLPRESLPSNFTCWCAKEVDVRSLPSLPPFSCGSTCGKHRALPKNCPHPCGLVCHAGPCPPCQQQGPTQPCFCGREDRTRRCVDTDYVNGWSCGAICGEMMPCGNPEHVCTRPCHEGLCGACDIRIDARCYCGQMEKDILCCDKDEERESFRSMVSNDGELLVERWLATFQCPQICGRPFDCGAHTCQQPCHRQKEAIPHCPRSPDVVTRCPCGKTPLEKLTTVVRTSCQDPIPACDEPCGKRLACGHACRKICHLGECGVCPETVSIDCRCGRTSSRTICHQGQIEPPECMRVCKANLNCGRHECGERCCPGEKKAAERTKKKPRSVNVGAQLPVAPSLLDIEAEHICTRVCNRLLRCNTHHCPELCHRGPCKSCREAIFEEIACNCGRTVLQPPLPCGTKPPPCNFPCERSKPCGHPQVTHTCHQDEESCPKCPFLTTKQCMCRKSKLKNQPCWLQDVRCGEVCGRKLKCGAHLCRKSCHRPGECEDADQPCKQQCGKEKTCSHPCELPCHSPAVCKEDKPCTYKTFLLCECLRIKQEVRCGATKHDEGNASKTLKCDDECARLERNRKLALALSIDPQNRQDDHIPYQAETLNMYLSNLTWAQTQEKELRAFAIDPDVNRLRFKPMKKRERAFLHSLAEDFGFDSESMDPEPHRHVTIFKTPRFVMAPMKTLAECARIRQTQRALTQQAASEAHAAKTKPKANLVGEPFNAFLISNARFGLTIEEIRSAIAPVLTPPTTSLKFDISFLPSEEVVLRTSEHCFASPQNLEDHLVTLQPHLLRCVAGPPPLGSLQLCRIDESLNILRRESDGAAAGWSQVAKAAAAPRRSVQSQREEGLRGRNSFAVFETAASRRRKAGGGKREVEVVDDWEAAELREEEREREEGAVAGLVSSGTPEEEHAEPGGVEGVAAEDVAPEGMATEGESAPLGL